MAEDLRLKPKDVDGLLKILVGVAAKWVVFIGQLGLKQSQIDIIERDAKGGSVECLRNGLLDWIAQNPQPTYGAIIKALRNPVLEDATLAKEVEKFAIEVKDVDGMDDIQFSVNMTVDELNELLKLKGVDEEDCALFRKTRINGKSFSKLTPVHLDKLGVSFGSRIIIDELLEDIGGVRGGALAEPASEQLPDDPIWDKVPSLGYLQLLKWFDGENKRQDLRMLRELAPHWENVARTLHLSASVIKIIEMDRSDQSGRIREVISKWLSNGSRLPEAKRYPVSWRGFHHLLIDTDDMDSMAATLKNALSARRSNIRKTF